LNDLRAYKLINNKHIPQEYLANSRRNRLQLLAGLLDTDGYFHNGCFDFTNKSKQLACDTVRLARSLGFAATLSKCRKASQHGTWGTYYRASISGDVSEIPCKLKRKQAPPRQQTKNVLHYGISVEPIGKGDYYGFEVDGDRLFLLGDYTVVHNTALGALWLMQRIQENPTGEFLQVSPTYKIFRRAAKVRWEETVQGLLDFESEYQPSYAQYKLTSGGKIYVASADNPDSFEGVQADAAWFDEAGQCNVKAWDAVKRRTNYKKSPILITTTPYLHNWLYKDVYQRWKAGDENYKVVQFPSYWNPTFDKSEFARLQSQEAQHKFSMFYKGEFARPSGLIYPELSTCVVPQPAVMPQGRLVGGADFGYNSPACFLAGVLAPDNTLWLFYERYMRKKTPTEHFPHLPKNVQWFADSAAPGEIRELRRLGTWIKPTKKFQGSVAYGISLVTRRIKAGKLQIIEGTCTNLITEGDNYRYAENEEDVYEDAPAKEQQDHACDALRYLVLGIDRKRKVDG